LLASPSYRFNDDHNWLELDSFLNDHLGILANPAYGYEILLEIGVVRIPNDVQTKDKKGDKLVE
jgi:hypothetical protein